MFRRFDQILHSDIEPELVEQLEAMTGTKVVRFSSVDSSFDNICPIMNKLCDLLWQRYQEKKLD
jgi:transcriptional regulator NrdR family protein